jgi:hypothetical protein
MTGTIRLMKSKHSSAESFIEAAEAESENIDKPTEKQAAETTPPAAVQKKEKIKKEKPSKKIHQVSLFLPMDTYLQWEAYKLKMLRKGERIYLKDVVSDYLNKLTEE